MAMESSPLISVQLKEAFLREVKRNLTAEEVNLWKSENRNKVCMACLSVQQNQPCGSSPSRCLPETPVPIPAGQPIVVACMPCIQRKVICSFNYEEGCTRVKRALNIDHDTFVLLWQELFSNIKGQGQRLAQYFRSDQQPQNSRPVDLYSAADIASTSASTSASASTSTFTSIFTSPISIPNPHALTISNPTTPAISNTPDNSIVGQRLSKVIENSREASNNLYQLYVTSQAQSDQLRAQLAHTQAQLDVSQRQHEELRRMHQQLTSRFGGATLELLRVRQENQDLLVKDLHLDNVVESLKERERDLQRRIEQERSERDGVQRQFDAEAAGWRDERLALAMKLREKDDELQRLTLLNTSARDMTMVLQQKLFKADEDARNERQEAERRAQTLDAVRVELSGQTMEGQRLQEALEQARYDKEQMSTSLQNLQNENAKAAEELKMAQAKASAENQALSSSLSEATKQSERLLRSQTNETTNIKQLVKEFAGVRAKFSDGDVSREDVENICDRLGMDLVVVLSRLEVKDHSVHEVQNPPKKRKLDAAMT